MREALHVYWCRRDLRLRDNPALAAATAAAREAGVPLLPLFVLEPYMIAGDPRQQFGMPGRAFLAAALPRLAARLPLACAYGRTGAVFAALAKERDLVVHVNDDVHPDFYAQLRRLKEQGVAVRLYRDQMTVPKDTRTGSGGTYSVFTPFKNAVWDAFVSAKEAPAVSLEGIAMASLPAGIEAVSLTEQALQERFSPREAMLVAGQETDLATLGLPERDLGDWYWDEEEALRRFAAYLKEGMRGYKENRDALDKDGTSRMSLALTWGLVSARTLVALIKERFGAVSGDGATHYVSELIWREFYKYLYAHDPGLGDREFQERMRHVRWAEDAEARRRFALWMQGRTGYPVVDAAMMQLARTGWMHNRARMIAASVLTKNLGVDWRWGQEYFRAMLVDLDEASNNGGWQWGASVGADPKPIRIFNPYLQAKKFDTDGAYQRRWLSDEYLADPPQPIVPHAEARADALERYGLAKDAPRREY